MTVFLISGLWHGANSSFVVWGGLNGLFQLIEESLYPVRKKICRFFHLSINSLGNTIMNAIVTFILVDFSWIFFRANSFHEAIEIINTMFPLNNPWILFDGSLFECGLDDKNFRIMIVSVVILFFADCFKVKGIKIRYIIEKQGYLFRCIVIVVSIFAILIFGKWGPSFDASNFIYFQF